MGLKDKLITLSHILKERACKLKWYSWDKESYNVTAVAVVDGRLYSGGLTDRFKGIISLYAWAKQKNIPFRISYTTPFQLSNYLIPNQYDWTVKEGDFVRNIHAADIIYSVSEPTVFKRMNNKGIFKQIHFYGNRDMLNLLDIDQTKWGIYFNELFKPTDNLRKSIDFVKNIVGEDYFSIVFRFQNLLGDFPEYDFKPLDTDEEKEFLVKKCMNIIKELIISENAKRCLVTSDSITFLERAKREIDGVYTIPGKVVHMGSTSDASYENYMKSFVDFFMLADSCKIYNIVSGDMYPSDFPVYAAKINNIPFERIVLP